MVIREDTHALTYSWLRWLLALLPGVLFIVTVGTAVAQGELEGSISAYYWGPVRDVFVGVMIAIAALLVAYQGATTMEDYNLNGAGFYAVFVALVPTGLAENLENLRAGADASEEGISPDLFVWSLRISLTVVVLLAVVLVGHELRSTERIRRLLTGDRFTRAFVLVTFATLLAFLGLVMAQLWGPRAAEVRMRGLAELPVLRSVPFLNSLSIHDLAAILLLCALIAAVWSHAWPRTAAGEGEQLRAVDVSRLPAYQAIFFAMLAGPVVAWVASAAFAPGHVVIFLEWWVIALFCTFWVVETLRQEAAERRLLERERGGSVAK